MNAVSSLNLATHDAGVAAISTFPLALDWLSIAYPPPPPLSPLSRRQAASALVRHVPPHREVLAPCFRVAGRFILGRTLGSLYTPPELNLPQEPVTDARFVLDLHNGSIVEVRQYARVLLCVAYARRRAEFVALPPATGRVEVVYRREGEELEGGAQGSWQHFCVNYASLLPTGVVTASVTAEPGPTAATFRKESIIVTLNDPFALSFCGPPRPGRRIAPRRLLPRPST